MEENELTCQEHSHFDTFNYQHELFEIELFIIGNKQSIGTDHEPDDKDWTTKQDQPLSIVHKNEWLGYNQNKLLYLNGKCSRIS